MKKLYRSRTDKQLGGVCGGIAEYYGIDSTLIRLGWILAGIFLGSGILLYIIALLVIPEKPLDLDDKEYQAKKEEQDIEK